IQQAALEVIAGDLDSHFVVDIFQTGSGTSSNMNSNEVIANRAKELLGGEVAVHPNDHVNMGQSSNDVFPSSIHIALASRLTEHLLPNLALLRDSLAKKEKEFASLVKTGRTHLQDATPMTLGQEFSGYRSQIEHGITRVEQALAGILELPLGGTAVGTGLNTPEGFAASVIKNISSETGLAFVEAGNHFEAQAAKDALVSLSGQLKTLACSFAKIANDLRWLASGPRCGLGEIRLPEVQPGSSIMPGKVNPVIAESVLMVSAQPNVERLEQLAEASIAICTALAPKIGYDKAASLAKEAFKSGKSLREVAREQKVLPEKELEETLNLMSMTHPGL
ncbi:UNVERIFIED_CONTAM: hypothetical protein GTU68_001077, partial [Idotea baltica]|nr:hypothetical protein [Idotea baltica]